MVDENSKISIKLAYIAMYKFLEQEYELTESDDIGGLLVGMSLLEDGVTADPAAWAYWIHALERVISGDDDIKLSISSKYESGKD